MLGKEGYVDIQVLYRQGMSIKGIVRELGVSRNTVRKYLRAEGVPVFQACNTRASKLDAFKAYLLSRVAAAHPDVSALHLATEDYWPLNVLYFVDAAPACLNAEFFNKI